MGVMDDDTIIFREAELLIDVMLSRSLVRHRLGDRLGLKYRWLQKERALTVASMPNTALINVDFPAPDLRLRLTI